MAAERLSFEPNSDLTVEERVDLVVDLTRRMGLLEDLLQTARARRGLNEAEMGRSPGEVDVEKPEGTFIMRCVVMQSWTH